MAANASAGFPPAWPACTSAPRRRRWRPGTKEGVEVGGEVHLDDLAGRDREALQVGDDLQLARGEPGDERQRRDAEREERGVGAGERTRDGAERHLVQD